MKRRATTRKGMLVTTIALDADLHRRLLIAAVEENAAVTEIARQAIADWLKRRSKRRSRSK